MQGFIFTALLRDYPKFVDETIRKAFEEVADGHSIVLLAEDEPTIRNMVQLVLQRCGFAVLTAADGQEAMELARSFPGKIDLLITDINMPRLSGDELARRILVERPETKILAMTGFGATRLEQLGLALPVLAKPFTPPTLIHIVMEIMERAGNGLTKTASSNPF
jgi:DNA-binding response OmpR family regulator